MRRRWLLLGLCACGTVPRLAEPVRYRPEVASESWCRLDAGVFAFVPHPQVGPPLVGRECAAPRRAPPPVMARDASTFAELVVEPGGAIEIPVQLPAVLQGAGCRIDSVLIAHGQRTSDLAIEIATAERTVPVVSYAQLPPPLEEGVVPRTAVTDGSGRRRAIWAPDAPPGENSLAVIADLELWPTGASLRFDGGLTADGAASVVFDLEPEPQPEPQPLPEPQPEPPPADAPIDPYGDGGEPPPNGIEPPAPAPRPALRQPEPLVLVAYRHRMDLAAPDSFSIVLRARERAFGIGIRSDRESADPRLSYRAPGAAEATPTHLVPQVGVVVSRCGRPVEDVLRDIR